MVWIRYTSYVTFSFTLGKCPYKLDGKGILCLPTDDTLELRAVSLSDSIDDVDIVEPPVLLPLSLLLRGNAFLLKSAGDSGMEAARIKLRRRTNGKHSITVWW